MFLLELRPAGRRLTVPENKAVRRIFYSQERWIAEWKNYTSGSFTNCILQSKLWGWVNKEGQDSWDISMHVERRNVLKIFVSKPQREHTTKKT